MRRIRKVFEAFEEMAGAVADGVELASELEAEFSTWNPIRDIPSSRSGRSPLFSHALNATRSEWAEISSGIFARPTPRERIIRRVRRA